MDEKREWIEVVGARVHNLKNISCRIPRNALTVITGLSGSGKSSLAFDTIYAEGQRRYIDTFSAYARGFLSNMARPDVDKITGLSPVISIEQKTTSHNPRSTVGTVTEVYDYLRLLFARVGEAYSYVTGERMVKYTDEQIMHLIRTEYAGKKILLLSPLVKNRKGHYKELFEQMRKKGFLQVRIDGELEDLYFGLRADRYKNHTIELVVDKLKVDANEQDIFENNLAPKTRLRQSVEKAMQMGGGEIAICVVGDGSNTLVRHFSRNLMCPTTGMSYSEPAPHTFSFNSPQGACPCCKGLGYVHRIDMEKIVPNANLSIAAGAIEPLGKTKNKLILSQIEAILDKYDLNLKTPFKDIPQEAVDEIMNGTDEHLQLAHAEVDSNYFVTYEGILHYIETQQDSTASVLEQRWANQFYSELPCPECKGTRLNKESSSYRLGGKSIAEWATMDISDLAAFIDKGLDLDARKERIATEVLREIRKRLQFMLDVGLGYLSLNRPSDSLSGGESQRIRLATQIGSQLVNVLYILDEPSIGLHQRDNERLIASLKQLRDMGNSVIVVEHDEQIMREADWIVSVGPKAGRLGGEITYEGTPDKAPIPIPFQRESRELPPAEHWLTLKGCRGNNLRNVDVAFPLGRMIGVTGVSGSGKSSLINQTLYPILSQHFYRSLQEPLPYDSVEGIEHIDKVIDIDQSPIGRTPRSNPATYTGVFTDIRNLFAMLPESKIHAWKPGRFSFNAAGGRCDACGGNGYKTIQMHFLPDVYVPCEACNGKRYNPETMEVRFKGKSIADVLDMTINQAVEFFDSQPAILRKIKTIQEVGLGYIKLGQSSTTLSGGESQRMKLVAELSRPSTGKTLYILDEPTTGLHSEDIRILMGVLRRLVDKGNTVIIIEHNLDVINCCDYLIDMGPEGGRAGGEVVAAGTHNEVKKNPRSLTGRYL